MKVLKRDKTIEEFNLAKIIRAVTAAYKSQGLEPSEGILEELNFVFGIPKSAETLSVEAIQDEVEKILMDTAPYKVAKSYILYRERHKESRFIRERIDYMNKYTSSGDNAATSSETDANANVTMKNVANLEGEVYKTNNRIIQRQRMKDKLKELYPEVSKQYEDDLNSHIIYTHDEASTPVLKNYCEAVSLYPLLLNGVGDMDGITPKAPKNLNSFCGQFVNLAFLLAAQCKGAVAFGGFFVAFNYYCIKEWGYNYYLKDTVETTSVHCLKSSTIGDSIIQAFQQCVWGINQPAGNRGYQSPL
jgi:ribonucleoside-triphosphate reductase